MAFEGQMALVDGTRVAGADLRTGAQFRFVKLDANGAVVLCAAITDVPYGVLQNNPNTGENAIVCVVGMTKLEAGGTIDEGAVLGTAADAQAVALTVGTDITVYSVGQAVTAAGAAAVIFTAVVNCASPGRAA